MYLFTDTARADIVPHSDASLAFTVEQPVNLDHSWEVALKELRIRGVRNLTGLFLINADIVQSSCAFGGQENLLRTFDLDDNGERDLVCLTFEEGYYMPLDKPNAAFINFELVKLEGDKERPLDISRIWTVLHFRKICRNDY